MKILACDLSSKTGWCCGHHDAQPRFGTFNLPKTGEDVGVFLIAFDDWLTAMLDVEGVEYLVFEAPLMLGGNRGVTNITTTRKLMALASHTEFVTARRAITCRESNVMKVKKFWTGSGHAKKPDMIAAAHRYGYQVKDDNQADAVALFCMTVHHKFEDQRHRWSLGQIGAAA